MDELYAPFLLTPPTIKTFWAIFTKIFRTPQLEIFFSQQKVNFYRKIRVLFEQNTFHTF